MTPEGIDGFIRRRGQAITWARNANTLTVYGVIGTKTPAETQGGLSQSDTVITITASEIRDGGYTRPRQGDLLTVQGKTYWVRDAFPLCPPGSAVPGGFRVVCRGEGAE